MAYRAPLGRPLSRRHFLRAAAVGGAMVLVDPLQVRSRAAVPVASDVAFAEGVASGEPTGTGITLWTKLAGLEAPARLQVEVSDDPGFGRTLVATEAIADPSAAGTARVRIAGGALKPGGQYFYRFAAGDTDSAVGRFRTLRPASTTEPLTIAFFSCQEYIAGYYHAHADLATRDDVDLVVCLGDYIYEHGFAGIASATGAVRQDTTAPDGETQTLGEYRDKYALYHSDRNLVAVREKFPLVAIWDDHEVEDNYAGTLPGGATTDRRVPFLQRRANGYRAWREAMPRLSTDDTKIYGSLPLGNAELFLLDSRRYRDDQPCNPTDAALVIACGPDQYNAPRTLLGAPQKAWLKDRLARSRAPWKIIANQVMMMSLDFPTGLPLNTDSWDGYGAERQEILDHLLAHQVKGVSFITGDIHTFFAGHVTPTGRDGVPLAGGDGVPVATEFVGGAISSPGIADRIAAEEHQRVAAALFLDLLIASQNPHMAFSDQAYKGYGILKATTRGLDVEYRAVHDARQPRSKVFSLARFHVDHATPQVQTTFIDPSIIGLIGPDASAASVRRSPLPVELRPGDLSLGRGDLSPARRRAARKAYEKLRR